MADRQPGFFEEIGEAITGSRRATPETRSLPEYTGMPELNRLTLPSFKAALGTLQSWSRAGGGFPGMAAAAG